MDIAHQISTADPQLGEFFEALEWRWLDLYVEYPNPKRLSNLIPESVRDTLVPFIGLGNGGYFCFWNRNNQSKLTDFPIVLVDRGELRASGVAQNLRELIGFFPYSAYTLMDIIGSWFWYSKTPQDSANPIETYGPEGLEFIARSVLENNREALPILKKAMARFGFQTHADPAGLIGQNLKSLSDFDAWFKQVSP